jgi:hypothetical protein
MAKRPDQDALRQLAVSELQSLLGSELKLVRGFARLVKQATSPRLRKFCREGVEYTERRVERVREALELLEAPVKPLAPGAMSGLIADAIAAGRSSAGDDEARDLAILTPSNASRIMAWPATLRSTAFCAPAAKPRRGVCWPLASKRSARRSPR